MKKITLLDGEKFTPTKIICIGLNYSEHIEEMSSKRSTEPVIFTKPNSSLHPISTPIPIPHDYGSVHHETELAVLIDKTAKNINENDVFNYIGGYALALDLTLRDMQLKAKEKGHPWAIAKGFDHSCPISDFVHKETIGDVHNLNITLSLNGELKQKGNTNQMIFKLPELISYISKFFTLEKGDIILTGTPAGVGPLKSGDKINAKIDNVAEIETTIV